MQKDEVRRITVVRRKDTSVRKQGEDSKSVLSVGMCRTGEIYPQN